MASRTPDTTSQPELRQEQDHVNHFWLALVVVGLAGVLFVLSAAAVLLFKRFSRSEGAAAVVAERPTQGPTVNGLHSGLFSKPAAGELLKQAQQAELGRYGWVDKQRGIVRLPIDVALDVVARETP